MAKRSLTQRFGGVLTQRFSKNCGDRLYTRILGDVSVLNTRERSTWTALHRPSSIHYIICTKQPSHCSPPSKHRRCYSSASVSDNGVFYPRRAVMYVPASDERKTKKAASLNVDTIVFDLEDGVAANQKVCVQKFVFLGK